MQLFIKSYDDKASLQPVNNLHRRWSAKVCEHDNVRTEKETLMFETYNYLYDL